MELRALSITEFDNHHLKILNDPFQSFASLCEQVKASQNSAFILVTGSTATSDCDGISAAGASPQERRLTPALDAEALLCGKTYSADSLPVSPDGISSPVVISRALVNDLDFASTVIDAGCFVRPKVDCLRFADIPASCLSSGKAMPREHVQHLFEQGVVLGKHLSLQRDMLVLAECVPAGTTTALAVLRALGHNVGGMTSSSLPKTNHDQKSELVERGLQAANFMHRQILSDPLSAVAAVGDPVQAVVAGIVIGANQRIPIVMGGGSQMLAIWALTQALNDVHKFGIENRNIFVCSTKWVGFDPSAAVAKLAEFLEAPFAVASPDFRRSVHPGLRAYEDGHVKEGAGAGAALCIAFMKQKSHELIMGLIDREYQLLLNRSESIPQISIIEELAETSAAAV